MRRSPFLLSATVAVAIALAVPSVAEQENANSQGMFWAELSGFEEVPAISTAGAGEFMASLDASGTTLAFELTYSGLEGGQATASHVHLGQRGVSGGVSFFLCGGGSKPACPAAPAKVTGTVVASDVVGPNGQGIAPGQFAEILKAMREGVTYANVHTPTYAGGEIRGQIRGIGRGSNRGRGRLGSF